jgi:hypothetical protein
MPLEFLALPFAADLREPQTADALLGQADDAFHRFVDPVQP